MSGRAEFSLEAANALLEELHHHQERFFFSQKEVLEITRESVEPLLKKTCKDIAHLMSCERVEIWLFNEDQTKLTAETSYDQRGSLDVKKNVLWKDKVPAYFDAIVDQRTLAIENTGTSLIMKGLRESLPVEYHSVESMLDASIVLSWGVGGVICCLSDTRQHWTPVHKHVLASVADMFAFIFDRLHRQEVEDHIYELAYTDTLTKLNNEHAFYELVTADLTTYPKGQRGIYLYLVVDQFIDIQGVLGHQGAEKVLINIANRLRETVPDSAVIARIAFDHFVIYSPVLLDEDKMNQAMQKITKTLRKPMKIDDQEVYITFSYGAAYYPDDVRDAKEGVQAAKVALEHGRQSKSRKAMRVFHSSMHTFMKENLLSEMNLRKGLELKEFRLFYQPKVQCETGEVLGFEALIRWKHPEKGIVYPMDFIRLAESTGLIATIDYWVIQEAFQQLGKWTQEGRSALKVSVNLSPKTFLSSNLPVYLLKCAQKFKVAPEHIMLEITETIALEDRVEVKSRMAELNKLGFSISIDDFGTGYSAFAYLQNYTIQEIKIDRQFIKEIEKNPESETITNAIVQLGRKLKLRTVAEGVETVGEWEKLKKMGCDEIQGFYFSKPLPAEEIDELMKQTKGNQPFCLPK